MYSVLQNSYEKIIKTANFTLEVGQRVFFFNGIFFSNFYAVAVKMRPRLESWSKSIFCQKYLKPIIITPATAKKCSHIVIKEGTN